MTAQTAAKVGKLLAEKRVMPAGAAAVYPVAGNHGDYVVYLHDDYPHCTCPARGDCYHLDAAQLLHDAIVEDRRLQPSMEEQR